MIAVLSLLLVLSLSILVTRVATIALAHTGLARESARFQARSAFTGAGFTTDESERVVNHPVRRRIVLLLMLLGNAGIVTAVSSLILAFVGQQDGGLSLFWKIALLVLGVVALWAVATSRWVDRRLSRLIDRMLRRFTSLDTRDYAHLMHLAGEYRLAELAVADGDWIAGRSLGEVKLRDEGILVLGIHKPDGAYLGTPDGATEVQAHDTLLVYARQSALESLDERQRGVRGDRDHRQAVREQAEVEVQEREELEAAQPAQAPEA